AVFAGERDAVAGIRRPSAVLELTAREDRVRALLVGEDVAVVHRGGLYPLQSRRKRVGIVASVHTVRLTSRDLHNVQDALVRPVRCGGYARLGRQISMLSAAANVDHAR